jgi:hypothetical protein
MATISGLTDTCEAYFINHLTGVTSFATPHIYIALSTTTPNEDGTGFSEPTIGVNGYARVDFTGGTNWNTATAGSVTNKIDCLFPTPSGYWGTITYFGLYTAATSGTLLAAASCGSNSITTGQVLRFAAGQMSITLN